MSKWREGSTRLVYSHRHIQASTRLPPYRLEHFSWHLIKNSKTSLPSKHNPFSTFFCAHEQHTSSPARRLFLISCLHLSCLLAFYPTTDCVSLNPCPKFSSQGRFLWTSELALATNLETGTRARRDHCRPNSLSILSLIQTCSSFSFSFDLTLCDPSFLRRVSIFLQNWKFVTRFCFEKGNAGRLDFHVSYPAVSFEEKILFCAGPWSSRFYKSSITNFPLNLNGLSIFHRQEVLWAICLDIVDLEKRRNGHLWSAENQRKNTLHAKHRIGSTAQDKTRDNCPITPPVIVS